jgi:hypothetical protein
VAENRYLYHWQRADSWYLIGAVLATAALMLGVGEVFRRVGGAWGPRWLRLGFVLALGQVVVGLVLAADAEKPREGAIATGLLLAAVTVWAFRRRPRQVMRIATTVALLAVPLGPILFFQILTWRSWRECGPPREGRTPARNARPVFVLLFDEWSLRRSERHGEFLPELVNLRRLAAVGTTYADARSPADGTIKSIPRILYGANGEVEPGNGEAMWRTGDSTLPAVQTDNLFRRARALGYRTELVGWYLPYAALLGDDLDACRTAPQVPKRSGPLRVVDLVWANLRYLPDPLSRAVWREVYARWFSTNWYTLEQSIEVEAMRLAREAPPNTLAFVHFTLPHAPFVFEADGRYRGAFEDDRMGGTVEDYTRQVRYLDAVLGRLLDELEAAGRLDSAVVVVTSDHSWKKDLDQAERVRERLRRVPLVVKAAGQQGGPSVRGEACLLDLAVLVGLGEDPLRGRCDAP